LMNRSVTTTSLGVTAPAQRAAVHITDCARSRSRRGSHVVNTLVRLGNAPASPAPKRKRVSHSVLRLHIQPVSAVNADHHSTTRIRTLRGPIQSPSQPLGTSNRA